MLGDKSIGSLTGRQHARVLPDGLLPISPGTGGLLWTRLGSSEGDKSVALLPVPTLAKPGTASWQRCLAGGLEKPRLGASGGGGKWGRVGLAPQILQWVVPKCVPRSPPWHVGRGLELALLPVAGGCPGVGTAQPAGFIYKQAGAGTGQLGTSGTRWPIMLIITT